MSEDSAMKMFDSADAAKLLRDKVRLAFVELIPEDQWEKMVKAEFKEFTESSTSYGNEKPSGFREVCRAELRELVRQNVKDVLEEEGTSANLVSAVNEYVKENFQTVFQSFIGVLFDTASRKVAEQVVWDMTNRG